jgi:hypothetical protein
MRWQLAVAFLSCVVTPVIAQETKMVTAGREYAASATLRRWFGEGYRDLWTTPFEVPVLDLSTEAGGLQPVRQVGGLQTAGLALRGADGKSYTFRSLHKEPERLLPAEWRNSWPAKLLRDATSATHPGAGVMLPVLAQAAGIPTTRPRLVVMPDDPRLGQFRAAFANQVGSFEEYPTAAADGRAGFEGATEIISTSELWSRWLAGPEGRIDSRAFLRARLLDLFVENYDRRRSQWRWMRIAGRPAWEPLPEDPDMAFVRHNGIVVGAMRARQPRLLEFGDRFPSNLEGPTSNAAEVDRWLLSDLERPVFEQVARELQAAWTDDVINRAVAQLPKEWQALDKGRLGRALRARRAALVPYVQRYYRYLARRVDVHLTNQDDRVSIVQAADHTTTISASTAGQSSPYYTRRFTPGETAEVRVYLHGGNDRVERTGKSGPIHLRVIAEGGEKTVQSTDASLEVWGDSGSVKGSKVHHEGTWKNPEPIVDAPWLEPRNFGRWTLWQPTAWYAADLGVVVGASLTRTTYGFRAVPAAKEQALRGGWSFGQSSGMVEYDGTFRRPASSMGFDLRAAVSGIEQVNFFGFGNDTGKQRRSRYHIQQTLVTLAPALRFGNPSRSSLTIGPELRYSDTGKRTGTILFEQAPYGIGRFGLADLRVTLETGTPIPTVPGLMAVALGTATGDTPDQPPGRGVRALASAFVSPAVMDTRETYGGVEGYLTGHVGGSNVQLAARVGGQRMFGSYPWFDAAVIGGANNRGFRSHRFAGDTSLYGNAELRTYLGGPMFASVFPVRFGLVGFVDTGRVWIEGEQSNSWHPSGGGGLLLKPIGTSIVLRAVAATGGEGTLVYLGSGFRF